MEEFYSVISEYTGEEGKAFKANSFEDAAEQYARYEDWTSAEYSIVGGNYVDVLVTSSDGIKKHFRVSGRTEAVYTAQRFIP